MAPSVYRERDMNMRNWLKRAGWSLLVRDIADTLGEFNCIHGVTNLRKKRKNRENDTEYMFSTAIYGAS